MIWGVVMATKSNAQDYTTTRADSAVGPGLQLLDSVPSPRRPRRSARSPTEPPDLGALARDAVVSFLHDATLGTAESEAAPVGEAGADAEAATTAAAAGNAVGDGARDDSSRLAAESVAWRAADASVAALDRIELAAAKIEADIATAYRAQADLQAKAGVAAEAAVHAAQSAWVAAVSAIDAEGRSKIIMRRIGQYLAVTVTLVVISIIMLAVTAGVAH
jgi:hypothetical protein